MLVGAVLCGCDTTESRIAKHRDYYASLGAGKQERLKQYNPASGDTITDVEIGWGVPHKQFRDANGNLTYVYKRSSKRIELDRTQGAFREEGARLVTTEICFRGTTLHKSREVVESGVHHWSADKWTYF